MENKTVQKWRPTTTRERRLQGSENRVMGTTATRLNCRHSTRTTLVRVRCLYSYLPVHGHPVAYEFCTRQRIAARISPGKRKRSSRRGVIFQCRSAGIFSGWRCGFLERVRCGYIDRPIRRTHDPLYPGPKYKGNSWSGRTLIR